MLSGQQGKTTDLMSTPEAEDTSGIPNVDGTTDMKSVPAIPEAGSEKAPATPVAPAPAEKPVDQIKDKVGKIIQNSV